MEVEKYQPTYQDRVYGLLIKMDNNPMVIDQKVAPENREKFVEIVKEFIRLHSHTFPWIIQFSNDYKKIRKVYP